MTDILQGVPPLIPFCIIFFGWRVISFTNRMEQTEFSKGLPHVAPFFSPPGSLQNHSHILLVLQKIKALPEGVQRLNFKNDTDQGRVLIHRRVWIPF